MNNSGYMDHLKFVSFIYNIKTIPPFQKYRQYKWSDTVNNLFVLRNAFVERFRREIRFGYRFRKHWCLDNFGYFCWRNFCAET